METEKSGGQKKRYISAKREWLTAEGLMLIRCWVRDGLAIEEIAKKIGIAKNLFYGWLNKSPELREAVYTSKELVDYEVENALLRRALGCKMKETKTIVGYAKKDGTRPVRTETTETEVLPDVMACMAWLNNRCPDKWKRNRDNFVSNEEEKKHQNVTINIIADKENKNVNVERETE